MLKIGTPRFVATIAALLMLALSAPAGAHAAEFSERTTKIVVPFAPGGGTDVIARTLAQEMAHDLGTVIIGSQAAASAEPDGHALLMATFAHAVNPSLRERLPYDTDKDFVPVALIARSFNIVVVNPKSDNKKIRDQIGEAKAHPAPGRRAQPDPAADGLPLPHPLPDRAVPDLQHRGSRAEGEQRRAPRRLSFPRLNR